MILKHDSQKVLDSSAEHMRFVAFLFSENRNILKTQPWTKIPTPKNKNNWLSLGNYLWKGFKLFSLYLPICSMTWIIIVSVNICFKCWCFISKWKKAVLIIILPFPWIKCSVCNSPVRWYSSKFDWFIKNHCNYDCSWQCQLFPKAWL